MPVRFAKVDDNLYRGGAPSINELHTLNNLGIKKIISLDGIIGNGLKPFCEKFGIEHIILPLGGGAEPEMNALPGEVVQWQSGGPTFVHCRHGKDRTGVAIALYRILVQGWNVDSAISEAKRFGIGAGLDPESAQEYVDAIRRLSGNSDSNSVKDIVTTQRDKMDWVQPSPGGDNASDPMWEQQSFAPFLGKDDYLNRPASMLENMERLRTIAMKKLAKNMLVFKYCKPSDVYRWDSMWFTDMTAARKQNENDKDARMFSADIDDFNSIEYPQEYDKTLLKSAIMHDADVVIFQPRTVNYQQVFAVDSTALSNVRQIGKPPGDINNLPYVGQHDNYTGMAPFVFPGSGGSMGGGSGGYAGTVQLPFGRTN